MISKFVMPGLVPGIHVFASLSKKDVDGRDEPGHDVPPQVFSIPSRSMPQRMMVRCSIGRSTRRSSSSQTMPMLSMPTTMRADWKYCWALKIW